MLQILCIIIKQDFESSECSDQCNIILSSSLKQSKTNLTEEEDVIENNSRTVGEVEKQLIESESQRLDLEDRVQALEERLDYYRNQDVIKEEKTCDETLHAKDQYITKLEKEKSELELESNKVVCTKRVVEPHREKTCLLGFRPGPTQRMLYSHTRWLET